MKKIVILFLLATLLFGCSNKKDTLIIGTNATFPPFEYLGGPNGTEVVGFDMAIAEEIAKKAGLKLQVEDMDFDGLIPALMSGKIDLAISGMTITEERAKNVDFSMPYYEAAQMVLIRKEDAPSFADIKTKEDLGAKKNLGSQLGTTGSLIAAEIAEGKPVVELKSYELVIVELKNKKIDAVVIDTEPAKVFIAKNDDLMALPIEFEAEFYGVAVKKGNKKLLKFANDAITEMMASGRHAAAIEEHIQNYVAN